MSGSFNLDNLGDLDASPSVAGIYLSADSAVTTSDLLLAAYGTPALTGGRSDREAFSLPLDLQVAPSSTEKNATAYCKNGTGCRPWVGAPPAGRAAPSSEICGTARCKNATGST